MFGCEFRFRAISSTMERSVMMHLHAFFWTKTKINSQQNRETKELTYLYHSIGLLLDAHWEFWHVHAPMRKKHDGESYVSCL
jgi:hypothetical protein